MSLFITSLNSGSNGNCYYVGNHDEGILVDAGIPCREIEKRMNRLALPVSKLKAIFISHEHTDHISGLSVMAKKHQLPVYITAGTLAQSNVHIEQRLIMPFSAHVPVQIGQLSVSAFPKNHDACDPHSFIIRSASVSVGVFTDIGMVCKELVHHFKECHAAFLEANYDEAMLMGGKYPYFLKNRIRGDKGHLSNDQAFELYKERRAPYMSRLILSHLSKENNCPKLVADLFEKHSAGTQITVASRYEETPLFKVLPSGIPVQRVAPKKQKSSQLQLSLF